MEGSSSAVTMPFVRCCECEAADLLETPKPEKLKVTPKRLKSDFWGLSQSNLKVTPKVTFGPENVTLSHFSGQKVNFGVTFRVALGETPKVTLHSPLSDF